MSHLRALFVHEYKRVYSKKNLVLIAVLTVLLLVFVHSGGQKCNKINERSKQFQEAENVMFSMLQNYTQYSIHGIRLYFIPSPCLAFAANSGLTDGLNARLNPVTHLSIYKSMKSNLRPPTTSQFWDFAGLVLLFGSFIALYLGFGTLRNKEYLKFLSSNWSWSPGKVVHCVQASRFLFIVLTFLVILALAVIVLYIDNVRLAGADTAGLPGYLGAALLMLLFFFLAGVCIGGNRTRFKRYSSILLVWVLFVFLVPGAFNSLMWVNSDSMISEYETELKKLKVVTDFEKGSYKKEGKFDRDNIEKEKELIESYFKYDYKKVLEIEERLKSGIERLVERYFNLSVIFPTTFYNVVSTELSSCGYINHLKFYGYCIEKHKGFVRFWIDRVFYHDPHDMKSFIRGDDNLYRAVTILPGNYLTGVLVNLVWIFLLYVFSYVRFKGLLLEISDHAPLKEKDRELEVKKGGINVHYTLRTIFRDQLYLKFTGQESRIKKTRGMDLLKVTLDKKEIKGDQAARGFIYLCQPHDIPDDLRGLDLVNYVLVSNKYSRKERAGIVSQLNPTLMKKTFEQMEPGEKFDVLVNLLPFLKGGLYLLHHTCKDLPLDYHITLKKQFEILGSRGATVIYLNPEKEMPDSRFEPARHIIALKEWMNEIHVREGLKEQ